MYYKNISILHPVFSPLFLFFCLSNTGFPGTSGFVGELIVLISVLKFNSVCAVIAASGMIFSAIYTLWMFNRICWGSQTVFSDDLSNPIFKVARFSVIEKNLLYYFMSKTMYMQGITKKIFFLKFFLWIRFVFLKTFFWDCTFREIFIFSLLATFIVGIGLFPSYFFSKMAVSSFYYSTCIVSHTAFSEWFFAPTSWHIHLYFQMSKSWKLLFTHYSIYI